MRAQSDCRGAKAVFCGSVSSDQIGLVTLLELGWPFPGAVAGGASVCAAGCAVGQTSNARASTSAVARLTLQGDGGIALAMSGLVERFKATVPQFGVPV